MAAGTLHIMLASILIFTPVPTTSRIAAIVSWSWAKSRPTLSLSSVVPACANAAAFRAFASGSSMNR